MKKFILIATMMLSALTMNAGAHEKESRVAIESDMTAPVQAGKVNYMFELVDTKLNKVLTDIDLNTTHEKKLHMLAYDPALKEFQHVHPEFDGHVWKVELNFSVNANYWVWTQGELASDKSEFTSSTRLTVQGGAPAWPAPRLTESRNGSSGVSTVALSAGKLTAGRMAMLTVKFARNNGTPAQITPYLGAFAHAVAVTDDGDSLLHVHPMDGDKPNEGMLHVTFPSAGMYRLWMQFMDGGELKVIPLAVRVY